jgi:hypothetical protein
MKKFSCLVLIIVMIASTTIAQKRNWEWTFGIGNALSFATGSPVAYNCPIYTGEGSASICDTSGKLLFYSEGKYVYDSTHNIMPNGAGLLGTTITTQSALIIPSLSNAQQYYLFVVSNWTDPQTTLSYNIVDMSLNGGKGDITAVKNIILNSTAREQLTAAQHANGQDVWVMVHEPLNFKFCAYLLSASGIDTVPVISTVGMGYGGSNRYGSLRFSHDCTKLASVLGGVGAVETLQLFDFDNATGIVSNPMTLATALNMPTAYSCEFSPDDSKLYATGYNTSYINQFDLNAVNIPASVTDVTSWATLSAGLQLAPDGKIYIASHSNFLGSINFPNMSGTASGHVSNAIVLTANSGLCLPNFYNFQCSTPTSISEANSTISCNLFPNPFSNKLHIVVSNEEAEIIIYDIFSRVCFRRIFSSSTELNTETFTNGVYLYEIHNGNDVVKRGKIVKE